MRIRHAPALLRGQPRHAARSRQALSHLGPKRDTPPGPDGPHETRNKDAGTLTMRLSKLFKTVIASHDEEIARFNVQGMSCAGCAERARKSVETLPGIA